jgi:hypothetical protein
MLAHMTIYKRTSLGDEAALAFDSQLPLKLRKFLTSIDGHTSLEDYISGLSSFGDVKSILDSMLQAGLIERDKSHGAIANSAVDETAESPSAGQAHVASNDTAISMNSTQGRFSMQDPPDEPLPSSQFQQPARAAPARYTPPPASSTSTAQYQLRKAISSMSNFLITHMPVESLELMLTLESLTSIDQLTGSLKGYQSLIEHVGQPARDHLAELRSLLASI